MAEKNPAERSEASQVNSNSKGVCLSVCLLDRPSSSGSASGVLEAQYVRGPLGQNGKDEGGCETVKISCAMPGTCGKLCNFRGLWFSPELKRFHTSV
jgi:hypothetical protein